MSLFPPISTDTAIDAHAGAGKQQCLPMSGIEEGAKVSGGEAGREER